MLRAQQRGAWTWQPSSKGEAWLGADPSEQRILLSLRTKRDVSLNKLPLKSAMERFSDAYGIPIVLDEPSLEEETVRPDEPVTLHVPHISLRSALRLILDPLHLTYVIDNEVLKITNRRNSANMLCVYEVRVLLSVGARQTEDSISTWNLMSTIETSIEPDMWANAGGTSTMSVAKNRDGQTTLVISAPCETHLAIQSLLNTLVSLEHGTIRSPIFASPIGTRSHASSVRTSRLKSHASW